MQNKEDKVYGESVNKNFKAVGTIGVPHPYMIGPRHVVFASDNYGGRLGTSAIIAGEKKGIRCYWKNCNLTHEEHEKAVLVKCLKDPGKSPEHRTELNDFLKSLVPEIEKDNCAGFTLVDMFSGK